jgi:hypothetical protein
MEIKKARPKRQIFKLSIFIIFLGVILWLIIPRIMKYNLHTDFSFYIAIIAILVWFCLITTIIYISNRMIPISYKEVMKIITAVMFVTGIVGSLITGDHLFNQGAMLVFVYLILFYIFCTVYLGLLARSIHTGHK